MTDRSVVPPLRTVRTLARSATFGSVALWLTVGAWATPAGATGSASGGSSSPAGAAQNPGDPTGMASLQVQAQELAGQIEADGRTLDELDAAYNAAQIRLASLNDELTSLQAGIATTTALVDQTRSVLKEQAVLAYLSGGAPLIYLPDHPGQDPSLSTSYAEIIAGGQRRAADAYRSELQSMDRQTAALQSTRQEAAYTVSSIRSDESQAAAALASQQRTLAQVKGQMAVLVSQVQQAQQQAQASKQAQQPLQPAAPTGAPGTPGPQAGTAPTANAPAAPSTGGGGAARGVPAAPTPARAAPTTTPAPATTAPASPPTTATGTGGSNGSGGSGASSSGSPVPAQAPGANAALAYARAQLGKPYQWAGAGPDSFDCSGLVMMAWDQGGVSFPHLAQDQYDMTARIPVSQALPGDLVFFGTPDNVYHVGIYIGNGQMIDAPETGQNVSVQSVYWDSLLGAGRVHT